MSESERIDALEATLAYQDKTIEDLSSTIADQWKAIDGLKRELANLKRQLGELEANPALAGPAEPPPPHY